MKRYKKCTKVHRLSVENFSDLDYEKRNERKEEAEGERERETTRENKAKKRRETRREKVKGRQS